MRDPKIALKFQTFAVARTIQAGQFEMSFVERLERSVREYPYPDDNFPRSVGVFCAELRAHRDQRKAVALEMIDFILNENMPVPPGQARKDCYG